jgi:hypothetical protein
MKERIKKFIQNNVFKTIGLSIFVGVAAYAGAAIGCRTSIEGQHIDVNIDGWDFVKMPEDNNILTNEEA